jgi:hypothetical protein
MEQRRAKLDRFDTVVCKRLCAHEVATVTRPERRIYQRYPLFAACLIDGASTNLTMRLSDLSIGGCFIDTPLPVPENAEITVYTTLAGRSLAMKGHVVNVQPRVGFGVAFHDLGTAVRQQLAAVLGLDTESMNTPPLGKDS